MVNPMIIILSIGVISAVFGLLMIFSPDLILKVERQANRLFMTDTAFLKNRIPIGIIMLFVSVFLLYTYTTEPALVILVTGIIAAIFGLLLIFSPNTILTVERRANKLYMTDAFFLRNRYLIGFILIISSIYMIYTYLTFA
tara:strand:- start:65 stop:487 length:423 start_codon:yes stop_codon:yes gene_type:complete